jgi:hypothetical protein
MRFVKQFQVHRSPEDVYAYLLDVENEARWNPWAIEVQQDHAGTCRRGDRVRRPISTRRHRAAAAHRL